MEGGTVFCEYLTLMAPEVGGFRRAAQFDTESTGRREDNVINLKSVQCKS